MKSIIDWTATPLGSAVLGYVLLGICTFLFKPKSPEEYAAMAARNPRWFFARWAAFWQFLGGLALDPAKMATGLAKVITGHVRPVTTGSIPAPAMTEDDESGPYRDGFLPALALVGALSLTQVSCTPQAKSAANGALSAVELACIFSSYETDPSTLSQICGVARDMIPIVRQLIGQREGARRAGVAWRASVAPDAGTDASSP